MIPLRTMIGLAADDYRGRYEAREYVAADGAKLSYRLLKPKDYDPQTKYPLVLFLHGAGERGDDNIRQLVHGMNDFASDETMAKYPCFVVAPQCPKEQKWVDVNWSAPAHDLPAQAAGSLRLATEAIAALEKEFSVDPARIYVTGLSMGGYGSWDAIARYPGRFAAAVPICGGGDPAQAKTIASTPIWAFHGGKDGVVKPQRSREMIEAIQAAGGTPKYTEYPDAGHDSWTATYKNPEFYAWLFAQRRASK
ncbi:MAG: prolyl oligopeptidase family serine peptidase [Pirellulaceae bacterium]|nr:prolyl oligopeptidase family serine peptidase [Pirellulaceae bacterium]